MRLQDTLSVIEALFSQKRGPYSRSGVPLTGSDSRIVREVYVQWICILIDLGYLDLEERKNQTVRLIQSLHSTDIMVVLNSLSSIYALVQRKDNTGFKALCRSIAPNFWSIVKNDMIDCLRGDLGAAQRLIQATAYPTRLTLYDVDQTEKNIEDYLSIERSLKTDDYSKSVVKSLNRIVRFWFKGFSEQEITFRHGDGAVAFCKPNSLENKYNNLGSDLLINYVFKDTYLPYRNGIRTHVDRVSETTFVAKSYKAQRTISMESPTLMYLQQGVLHAIDCMVERNPYLRNRIGTHEQERNVRLAKEASLFRNYATIDLSAASDSVPWNLVKQVFRGTPVYKYLLATRSRFTYLPNGELVPLDKFAPMGSALCFPIETILFASICELVTRRWAHVVRDRGRKFSGDFSVYGDDIIVPVECSEDVISILTDFGFSVNTDKSFYTEGDWYRESCGGEFINGFDVTPMRISRKYKSYFPKDDISISCLIDLANRAYSKGFELLRSFFLKKLQKNKLTSVFGDKSLLSDYSTNYQARTRYNRHLQRVEYIVSQFVRDYSNWNRGDDDIAYRHWLERNTLENQGDKVELYSRNALRDLRLMELGLVSHDTRTISQTVVSKDVRFKRVMRAVSID